MSASTSASSARWSSETSQVPLNAVTIPGETFTMPVVARTSSRARGVVAPRQRAARGGEEGVAAQVHRRRAGVRVRAGEAHRVALDAERAEHDAEREVELLEHRPLLDVQLEVGERALEPRARLAHAVEVDAVGGERVRAARCRRGR